MRAKKAVFIVLCVIPLLLGMTTEEAEHGSGAADFLGKVVNSLILFGGLTYLLYKPIKKFLGDKADEIGRSLKEADASRKDAEQRLGDVKIRTKKIAEEVQAIAETGMTEADRTKKTILETARKEAERVKNLTNQEIEMLIRAGTQDLREYAAELAISLARERIQKKIAPGDQSALIDKSIERLDRLHEKSGSR